MRLLRVKADIAYVLLFFFLPYQVSAQFHNLRSNELKANSRWFFGDYGINFNQDPPELLQTPRFLELYYNYEAADPFQSTYQGLRFNNCVPVSDPQSGNLRFVATRDSLYDRNLDAMPNGGFSSDEYEPINYQKSLAVAPLLNDPDKYYFFNTGARGLTYSIVDMALNNGKGDVDPQNKDIVIKTPQLAEFILDIIGIIPGNNCDYWLLLAENAYGTPFINIYSLNITASGINTNAGMASFPKEDLYESQWDYQFSPNRDFISFISHRDYKNSNVSDPDTKIHFLRFNLDNGTVSQSALPDIELGAAYGGLDAHGSFTPDNQYYIASKPEYNGSQVIINKYDLSAPANGYNMTSLSYPIPYWLLGAKVRDKYIPPVLYFKPYNNKLYFNIPYSFRVPSVEPGKFNIFNNNLLKMCSIEPDNGNWNTTSFGAELPLSLSCRFFMNNDVVYPYPPTDTVPHVAVDSVMCFDPSLIFPTLTLQAKPGFDSYVWNDGSTGSTHTIKQAGKYWVYYKGSCNTRVDTFIYRYRAPEHILQPDTVPCEERFPIEITADAATWYQWDDNSTQQKRTIYHPGTYSVQFERWGCRQFDTITIGSKHCPCNISVPNAFTPNGDGLNDFFKPSIALGCVPSEYSFRILNRWGQIVYGSFNEFDQGWDGTYKGGTADAGTYIYELRFKSRFLEVPYYKKGELILVR